MELMKESPLTNLHRRLGAEMAEEEGWNMPQQYADLVQEHLTARTACGLFDISHLGKFRLLGNGAMQWLEEKLTNSIADCCDGHVQHSLMLRPNGTILDRMTLFRESAGRFFLTGAASLADTDFDILQRMLHDDSLELKNETDLLCAMALSGTQAGQIMGEICELPELPRPGCFSVIRQGKKRFIVSRGELVAQDSYEFFCPAAEGIKWFENFMRSGAIPCGSRTREYLRISRGWSDINRDMSSLTPAQAALSHLCAEDKHYTGRDSLVRREDDSQKIIFLRCDSPELAPQPGSKVQNLDGKIVGSVTSATPPLSHEYGYALAYVSSPHDEPGTHLHVMVNGEQIPATVRTPDKPRSAGETQ